MLIAGKDLADVLQALEISEALPFLANASLTDCQRFSRSWLVHHSFCKSRVGLAGATPSGKCRDGLQPVG
jgi:hypothetical protein